MVEFERTGRVGSDEVCKSCLGGRGIREESVQFFLAPRGVASIHIHREGDSSGVWSSFFLSGLE